MPTYKLKPLDLSQELLDAWHGLADTDPAFAHPLFRPEYVMQVARVRDNVEVAVFEEGHEPVGFFPYERHAGRIAKPVGRRLSDCHGMIGRVGGIVSARELLRSCGLAVWDFNNIPASQSIFEPYFSRVVDAAFIDISDGWEVYMGNKRRTNSKTLRRSKAQFRKMEREVGPIRLEAHTPDDALLELLFEWKSKQFKAMGVTDIFSYDWVVDLVKRIHGCQTETFAGMLTTLFAGDRPVALNMGIRSRNILHSWYMAYDVEMAKYSPGTQLYFELIKAAAQAGIMRIDIGRAEGWKLHFMNGSVALAEGSVDLRAIRGPLLKGMRGTKEWLRSSPLYGSLKTPSRVVSRVKNWFGFR